MLSDQLFELLKKLISFESVTPKGLDALEFISNFLEELGFETIIKTYGEGDNETSNLYARIGEEGPNLCFAGHIDVVPADQSWKYNPFEMTLVGDKLYGRGMVDMKGAVACFLAAIKEHLSKNQLKGAITVILTTDEEGTGDNGIKIFMEDNDIKSFTPKIDLCLLGEPTSERDICDVVKIGRRGSINFDLTIKGMAGHVAYPEKADNPIIYSINILKSLKDLVLDNGSEYFQPSKLVITSIDTANNVTNLIPSETKIKFNIRFNDKHSSDSLIGKITALIEEYTNNYELNYHCSSNSFIQEKSKIMDKIILLITNECGYIPKITTNGGTSDARYLHKYFPVMEIGLNNEQAHKTDEYCKISDLQTLYNVYYSSLEKFYDIYYDSLNQ